MTKESIWSRDFLFCCIIRAASTTVFMLLNACLATYCILVYNSTVSEAGIAVGLFIIASLVSRLIAGRYVDIVGRKKMAFVGQLTFFLISFGYLLPFGFLGLCIVRILHGLAFGVANNTITVIVTSYIPQKRMGEGLGYFSLGNTIATALGPFVGIILLDRFEPQSIFWFCAVLAGIAFVLILFMKVQTPELSIEKIEELKHGFHVNDFLEPSAIPLSAVILFSALCYGGVNSFLNTYATEVGLGAFVPAYFLFYSLASMVERPVIGKLLDKRGDNIVVYPIFIGFAIELFLLGVFPNVVTLFLGCVLISLGYGQSHTTLQTIVLRSTPPEHIGKANATYFAASDIGLGFGPMIIGAVQSSIGFEGSYLASMVVIIAITIAYHFIHGRKAYKGTYKETD